MTVSYTHLDVYKRQVLVECGFLSNESEAQKLNDPQYQEQMAFAIYSGFLDYYQATR